MAETEVVLPLLSSPGAVLAAPTGARGAGVGAGHDGSDDTADVVRSSLGGSVDGYGRIHAT